MGGMSLKNLVIIPAYNEEKNLNKLINELKEKCPQCDVLIINDCSTDGTRFLSFDQSVHKIDLPSNLGIGGAVQTGYKFALYNNYDIAIQVDGDGQHNPDYIKDLIGEIQKGYNLCVGSRFINKTGFQSTFARRLGIKYFSFIISLVSRERITDPTSGFRACDKRVIKLFAYRYPTDYPEPETLVYLKKRNLKIKEIPVVMNKRENGESSINFLESIYYMLKVSMAVCLTSISK